MNFHQLTITAFEVISFDAGNCTGTNDSTIREEFLTKITIDYGSLVKFFCEKNLVLKQQVLIMVTCPSKVDLWTTTMLSKLATFPYIHWVGTFLHCIIDIIITYNYWQKLHYITTRIIFTNNKSINFISKETAPKGEFAFTSTVKISFIMIWTLCSRTKLLNFCPKTTLD